MDYVHECHVMVSLAVLILQVKVVTRLRLRMWS